MKALLVLLLALPTLAANKLRAGGGTYERNLTSSLVDLLPDDYFIMSQIQDTQDWCLTAVEGTKTVWQPWPQAM